MSVTNQDLLNIHMFSAPDHVVLPRQHLNNARDSKHYEWSLQQLQSYKCKTVLDVGCWDGWLDMLLTESGYQVEGVEIVPDLINAADRYAFNNAIAYKIHQGLFHEVSIDGHFDAVLLYEILEHIPLEIVEQSIDKAESLGNLILVSLPNQTCEQNPQKQHRWTPTEDLIKSMWQTKPNYSLQYAEYSGGTPANWFISWTAQ